MSTATADNPGVVILPPLLFLICVIAGGIGVLSCPYRFHPPPWVRIAFGGLAVGSIAFAIWGERELKAAGTNVHPGMPTLAIVSGGPYAYSRNPLYLSLVVLFAAVGLALASPAFLVFVVPLILVLHFGVVLPEERYLNAKFGDAYRGYTARVRRWI